MNLISIIGDLNGCLFMSMALKQHLSPNHIFVNSAAPQCMRQFPQSAKVMQATPRFVSEFMDSMLKVRMKHTKLTPRNRAQAN
jgi:hypothetical protein